DQQLGLPAVSPEKPARDPAASSASSSIKEKELQEKREREEQERKEKEIEERETERKVADERARRKEQKKLENAERKRRVAEEAQPLRDRISRYTEIAQQWPLYSMFFLKMGHIIVEHLEKNHPTLCGPFSAEDKTWLQDAGIYAITYKCKYERN